MGKSGAFLLTILALLGILSIVETFPLFVSGVWIGACSSIGSERVSAFFYLMQLPILCGYRVGNTKKTVKRKEPLL